MMELLEEFSCVVEKRGRRFFSSRETLVCVMNALSHTELTDQLETWHLKNAPPIPG